MSRALIWLVSGALSGAATTLVLLSLEVVGPRKLESVSPVDSSFSVVEGTAPNSIDSAVLGSSDAARAELLDQVRRAAALDDPESIKAVLLAALTNSTGRFRDMRIEVFLSRLADYGITDALRFARAQGFEERFLVPLIASLSEDDLESALTEAGALTSPYSVRRAALAIVDVLGADTTDIDQVAETLPAPDRIGFRIEALAKLAATNPSDAIENALALEGVAARRRAIQAIAAVSATPDSVAAFTLSDQISDVSLIEAFRFSAISAMAEEDPGSAIENLKSAGSMMVRGSAAEDILAKIADRIPDDLLAAADEFPQSVQGKVKRFALRATGEQNPQKALTLLASVADANDRGALLAGLSAVYARNDPNTALKRVLDIDPGSRIATVAVLNEIAQLDFERAVTIALENPTINNYTPLAALPINAHLDRARAVADNLVADGDSHESVLAAFVRNWTLEAPDEALRWALSNREFLDDAVLEEIATFTARRNAADAAVVYRTLPREVGDIWLAAIMPDFADQDPASAAQFALSLPEGQIRDQAIAQVIRTPLSRGGSIDVTVLDALSSSAVRDEVIADTFNYMRPAILYELEKLVPYIADSSLRMQFDEALESMR